MEEEPPSNVFFLFSGRSIKDSFCFIITHGMATLHQKTKKENPLLLSSICGGEFSWEIKPNVFQSKYVYQIENNC